MTKFPLPFAPRPRPFAPRPRPFAPRPLPFAPRPRPLALCPLPSALCPLPSALCTLPFFLRTLPFSLCTLPFLFPPPLPAADHAPLPRFERIVIDDDFPGAYQVEVADVDGDGKPDVVALGGGTVAWYRNPTWTKRLITGPDRTPGVISSATLDLDGDGRAEVAIAYDFAMNEPTRGELLLATQGAAPDDPWTTRHLGHFGSIHRLRWGDLDGDGHPDLIVAPIFGEAAKPPAYDQAPARLVALRARGPVAKAAEWAWDETPLAERPVIHAIAFVPPRRDDRGILRSPPYLLTADNLGVASISLVDRPAPGAAPTFRVATDLPGAEGPAPQRGCSEVHVGRLGSAAAGAFVATIEPWHGRRVAVWTFASRAYGSIFTSEARRTILDDTLDAGHALWVADVDGDGDDEVFAGHRGDDHRVSAYNFNGQTWDRTVLDRDIAAQDLRGGDLDGDGTPDLVAVGGATRNVVWYRPVRDPEKTP